MKNKIDKQDLKLISDVLFKNEYAKTIILISSGIFLFYIGGKVSKIVGSAILDYKTFIKLIRQ